MRLLKEIDKAIYEVLEDIDLRGMDCPAVLYRTRAEPHKIIYYAPQEVDASEKVVYIDEIKERVTLLEVLFCFLAAKKTSELKRQPTQASIIVTAGRFIKNLTQEQFAKELGVPIITLRCWENGSRSPAFEGMMKLLKFCGFNDLKLIKV